MFIPQFWRKKLTVKARAPASEYTPLSRHTNLDDICITKVFRKIRNDHTFSYGNKFYFIESPLRHSIANQKIEIRTSKYKYFKAYFAGRQLQVSEVTEPVKASMEETDVQKKLDVLALADKLGNVAEASRLSGVSRDTIYRHRRLLKEGGINALKRQETPNLKHKNCTELSIENTVVQFSIEYPHLGQQKVALKVKAEYGMDISPGGVRSIWLRQNMNTTALRVARAKSIQQTA